MLRIGILSLAVSMAGVLRAHGADLWGGSIAVTNDYLLRGISRSNGDPAAQIEMHYTGTSGLVAGVFASNTQLVSHQRKDAELDAFAGYAWTAGDDWRARALVSYYTYPFNADGSEYNYVEADAALDFQQWLELSFVISPDAPRYLAGRGLAGVASEAVEVNVQRPVIQRLSGTAGIGFAHYAGPDGGGYVYWSLGIAYDLRPVALAVSYTDTTAEANYLFYKEAAHGRWVATVIWRF